MKRRSATIEQRQLVEACLDEGVPFFWQSPGTLLISRIGLPEVLRRMSDQEATILGVEGFELMSTEIHPRLDLIFDAERRPDITDPMEIISEWPDEIWVDITLELPGASRQP